MGRKEHKIIDCIECKHCYKCNTWKPLTKFYKNKRNWDGLAASCNDCSKKLQKEFRKTEKGKKYRREYQKTEKWKEYFKGYRKTEEAKERQKEHVREYRLREDVKEKNSVRNKTVFLLKKLLPKWKRKYILCEVCGEKPYEEFHHFVYDVDKPLCGVFVCGVCHNELHNKSL